MSAGLRRLALRHAERGRARAEAKRPGVTSASVGDVLDGVGRVSRRDESGVRVDGVGFLSWSALAERLNRVV